MKILMLTKYSSRGPSSRYRFLQYIPALHEAGHQIIVKPFFSETYLNRIYSGRRAGMIYVLGRYVARIMACLMGFRYDLVWIEGELFPYLPGRLESTMHPFLQRRFYDYDDAIWLRYRDNPFLRHKFKTILKRSQGVVAGNPNLKSYFEALQPNTTVVPTTIDWDRYDLGPAELKGSRIGWVGTPKTVFFLEEIRPVLNRLVDRHPFTLVVIGAEFKSDRFEVECLPWTLANEIRDLRTLDIGIMPLRDDAWSQGKCGLKLIQYLAAGIPAVASPVGVNQAIIDDSGGGYLATDEDQWLSHLECLLTSQTHRQELGTRARSWIRDHYSIHSQVEAVIGFLTVH